MGAAGLKREKIAKSENFGGRVRLLVCRTQPPPVSPHPRPSRRLMTSALPVRLVLGAILAARLLALPTTVAARPARSVPSSAVFAGDSVVFERKGCGPAASECRVAYALSLDDGEQFKVRIELPSQLERAFVDAVDFNS